MTKNPYVPDPRKWQKKEWLYEQYWRQCKSASGVAEQTDVSRETILRAMTEFGIPRRPPHVSVDSPTDVSQLYRYDSASYTATERSWTDVCNVAD